MRKLILLLIAFGSLNAQFIRFPFSSYGGFSKVNRISAILLSDPEYVNLFTNAEIQKLAYDIGGSILPKRIEMGKNLQDPGMDEILEIAEGRLAAPIELELIVSIRAMEVKPDHFHGYLEVSLTEKTESSFIKQDLSRGKSSLFWVPAMINAPFIDVREIFSSADKKEIRNLLDESTRTVFRRLINLMLEEP